MSEPNHRLRPRGEPPAGDGAAPPRATGAEGGSGDRLLLIFAPSLQDPGFLRQAELLDDAREGLAERKIVVVKVIGPDCVTTGTPDVPQAETVARLRVRWQAHVDVFTVVVAGPDGTEKLRANQPMSAGPLFAAFDGTAAPRDARQSPPDGAGDGGG